MMEAEKRPRAGRTAGQRETDWQRVAASPRSRKPELSFGSKDGELVVDGVLAMPKGGER